MSECYECLNTGTVLVCDECGTPSAEPRITPAMVANLKRHSRGGGRVSRKAKRGSVTDDMPSPGIVDGNAIGATLDRIRVQRTGPYYVRCTTCDRPVATHREETTPRDEQNPAICYFNGGLACHKNEVDWRARALDAEAALATVAELAHLQAPIIERVTERADLAESIARRALVEGLKECERLRALLLAVFPPDRHIGGEPYWFIGGYRLRIRDGHPFHTFYPLDEQAIRTDAARAERELIVAELQARAAENRAAQQGAAIERQALVADEAGRRAAQLEHLAAFFQRGDHAKGGG